MSVINVPERWNKLTQVDLLEVGHFKIDFIISYYPTSLATLVNPWATLVNPGDSYITRSTHNNTLTVINIVKYRQISPQWQPLITTMATVDLHGGDFRTTADVNIRGNHLESLASLSSLSSLCDDVIPVIPEFAV